MDFDGTKLSDTINDDYEDSTMLAHSFYTQEAADPATSTRITFLDLDRYQARQDLSAQELALLFALQFSAKVGEIVPIFDAKHHLSKVFIGSELGREDEALATAVTRLPVGRYYSANVLSEQALLSWGKAQYRYQAFSKLQTLPRVLAIPLHQSYAVIAELEAIFLARDLINAPANIMGPAELVEVMTKLAKVHHAEVEHWVGEELIEGNFPAIHAVGRASAQAPRLAVLTWGDSAHPRISLVGKGVCFDSGGLDIKNASGMRLMKKDMGGAAITLGLAQWMMSMKLPVRLQVLIPAVENSLGSSAYRPGDVLTMRNGMTVEIDNTDAEGRLILADALVKASEFTPELLIDFATLTGAARVAVGTEISALFSNDEAVAKEICQWGAKVKDPVWPLPLYQAYRAMFVSSIADLLNSSPSPYAGAIVAALFLEYFVSSGISWVHFDLMAWNVQSKAGKPEGGEAMAMQAVGYYLMNRYGKG